MGQPVIIRNLYKSYGKLKVLKGLDLEVGNGEIFGLLGPNGAGKSTLIRIISGLTKPTSGNVIIGEMDALKKRSQTSRRIGVAPQKDSFYDSLSVTENIYYFGSLYGIKKSKLKERTDRLLEMFSLKEKKNVAAGKLSGGMKKKLNIICSLIHEPEILILDEPTAGLDPISKRSLWEAIKRINKSGTTVMISSHLMDDIENLCTRVAIIVSGKVVVQGTLSDLKRFIGTSILRVTVRPSEAARVRDTLMFHKMEFEMIDNVIMLRTDDPQVQFNMIKSLIGSCIESAETVPPTIEDVFLYYVGGER